MIYQYVKKEIEDSLSLLEPVIKIIDDVRARPNKIATEEESEKIRQFRLSQNITTLALILESKSRKRNAKNNKYEPFILWKEKDINNFCKYLAGIPKGKKFHYDIILRPDDLHSSAMQIDSDGTLIRTFYIDSYEPLLNNKQKLQIEDALGDCYQHNHSDIRTQNSNFGCSIFAIQNLNKMSREYENGYNDNFHGEKNPSLAPYFVKHVQSRKTANKYYEANQSQPFYIDKKNSKELKDHIEDCSINVLYNRNNENIVAAQNYSMLYKMQKYLEESLVLLDQIYFHEDGDRSLIKILSKRQGHDLLNSVYAQMNLSEAEKAKAEDLYNQDQIKLLLYYGLDKDKLSDAPCFLSKKTSEAIFDHIQSTVELSPDDEKFSIAQKEFDSFNKCNNVYQFYAMNRLEQKIDTDSIFWKDKEISKASHECIEHYYRELGEDGVNAIFNTFTIIENYLSKEFNIEESSEWVKQFVNAFKNGPDSPLITCIDLQNIDLIIKWLRLGAKVDGLRDDHYPLERALETNNKNIITTIIMAGATITDDLKQKYSDYFSKDKVEEYLTLAEHLNPEIYEKIKQAFPDIEENRENNSNRNNRKRPHDYDNTYDVDRTNHYNQTTIYEPSRKIYRTGKVQ